MGVGDKDLFNLAHLHVRLLDLVLRSFTTVEKPDIGIQSQGKCRVISSRGRLRRSSTKKREVERCKSSTPRHDADGCYIPT